MVVNWTLEVIVVPVSDVERTKRFGTDIPGRVEDSSIGRGTREDLIHRTVGGMLREAGEKDRDKLLGFLDRYAAIKPRTLLRYAMEHLDKQRRDHYRSLK
jgi:hypothetical protein